MLYIRNMFSINQKSVLIIFVLLSISLANKLYATDYYISNNGSNNATGLSQEESFRTLEKINSLVLKHGDRIFFKAGDTFTGTLNLKYSGSLNNPITLSSYGGEKKPVLSGSFAVTNIKQVGDNRYEASCENETKYFYLDGKLLTIAREPNSGFFTMDGGGIDYLVDLDQKLNKEVIIGSTVRMRITNWNYEYREAVYFSNYKIVFDSMLYNTSFKNYTCNKGYGYYLDNKAEFLDANNESYWSPNEKKVCFISSDFTPNSKLRAGVVKHGVILNKGVSNIIIEKIALEEFLEYGIHAKGNNKNIQVKNCTFNGIIKMGFYAKKHCENIVIANNILNDITGTGIRLKAPKYSIIENNRMKRIGLIPGYGVDGINGAIGISVENLEELNLPPEEVSSHNLIRNNYIDSTGYMSVRMDGFENIFEKNVVKNGLLTMNDGGLIHTYGADITDGLNLKYTHSSIIRDNIFINCIGNTESSANDHKIINGIYLDARSNKFTIENNIVVNCGGGILLNDKTRDCIVKNNIIYGNSSSSLTVVQSNFFNNLNHRIIKNVFFNTQNRKSTLSLINNHGTYVEPGHIDSNLYVSPNEMFHIKRSIVEINKWKNTREYTLEGWKEEFNKDYHSTFLIPEKDGHPFPKSDVFINESNKTKIIKLHSDMEYMDLQGNSLNDELMLDPMESKILIYRAN